MNLDPLILGCAGIVATAAPILLAALGETISERAGVINLSLNGTIVLSALAGFAAALHTNSVACGFTAGAAVGALVAAIVAAAGIGLRLSQIAVGFVLALTLRDLAYFLGSDLVGIPGPRLPPCPVPGLCHIPILGPIVFNQDLLTYAGLAATGLAWYGMRHTRPGLVLQGLGERPAAAFARGLAVNRLRLWYAVLGGALSGLAGPAYSLSVKAGWNGSMSGLDGIGWVSLAITVFGGWNPLRAALGAFLFAFLQWLGIVLQPVLPGIPAAVFNVAPFPLMILALLAVSVGRSDAVRRAIVRLPPLPRRWLRHLLDAGRATPPAALGVPFEHP